MTAATAQEESRCWGHSHAALLGTVSAFCAACASAQSQRFSVQMGGGGGHLSPSSS